MQTLPFTVLSQYLIQTKVTKKTDKVYQKSLLIKNTYPTEHRHGRDHVAFRDELLMSILRDVKCRNDINSKKIPVPGRIWTHDLPWFSQALQPLSYWRPYGEQDEMWLEAHHVVTQLNDALAHKNSPTTSHLELAL